MASRIAKADRLYLVTMVLAMSVTLANVALSYQAIQTIFMFFFDYLRSPVSNPRLFGSNLHWIPYCE